MATFGGKEGERMINSRNRRQIRAVMEPKEKTIDPPVSLLGTSPTEMGAHVHQEKYGNIQGSIISFCPRVETTEISTVQ